MIVLQAINPRKPQCGIGVGWIQTHDFAILFRRARKRIALSGSVAQIAQHANVNPRQQPPGGKVVRILRDDGLCFEDSVPYPLRLKINFGKLFADLMAVWIDGVSFLKKINRSVGIFRVARGFVFLLIVMPKREIVVGIGARIRFAGLSGLLGGLRFCGRSAPLLRCRGGWHGRGDKHEQECGELLADSHRVTKCLMPEASPRFSRPGVRFRPPE